MQFLLFLPILLSVLSISTAWRTFLRGRSKGGNLGEPVLTSETISLPQEQWFMQYLDHFNPTDVRVWKQVIQRTILITYYILITVYDFILEAITKNALYDILYKPCSTKERVKSKNKKNLKCYRV